MRQLLGLQDTSKPTNLLDILLAKPRATPTGHFSTLNYYHFGSGYLWGLQSLRPRRRDEAQMLIYDDHTKLSSRKARLIWVGLHVRPITRADHRVWFAMCSFAR